MKRISLKCAACGGNDFDVEIWGDGSDYTTMSIICQCGKATPIARLHNDRAMLHKKVDVEPINSLIDKGVVVS